MPSTLLFPIIGQAVNRINIVFLATFDQVLIWIFLNTFIMRNYRKDWIITQCGGACL